MDDADPRLEGATYSILEEDEDNDVWRIDAFPTTDDEVEGLKAVLAGYPATVLVEKLADADWLAMSLSGLPPVDVQAATPQGPIDARYRIEARGRSPRWAPTAVFNDGARTFITLSPDADIDDLIVVFQQGAYGLTASPTAFLGHPAPAEVLV